MGFVSVLGLKEAVQECQRQMKYSRWDCSLYSFHQKKSIIHGREIHQKVVKKRQDDFTILNNLPILRYGTRAWLTRVVEGSNSLKASMIQLNGNPHTPSRGPNDDNLKPV